MRTIYRNSPVPRYHQLKEILREKVSTEEWKPGDLIPSERELSETYSISRMTARQAITDLVNEGLFYREQGRGTFVADNRITQQLLQLTGFTEDIQARGQRPSTIVLSAAMPQPTPSRRSGCASSRARWSSVCAGCAWQTRSRSPSRSHCSTSRDARRLPRKTSRTIPSINSSRPSTAFR